MKAELRFKIFKNRQILCNFVNDDFNKTEGESVIDEILQIVETTENGSPRFVLYYFRNPNAK